MSAGFQESINEENHHDDIGYSSDLLSDYKRKLSISTLSAQNKKGVFWELIEDNEQAIQD